MLINHNTKQYWWGPPRTGSRMVSLILKDNGWREVISHHGMEVIDGYQLWISVRNPYERVISMWKNSNSDFHHWITTNKYFESPTSEVNLIKKYNIPFNTIRCESLKEELDRLNVVYREDLLDRLNKGVEPWRIKSSKREWVWDEDNVEIVWEVLNEYFELFGYQKNSWKSNINNIKG